MKKLLMFCGVSMLLLNAASSFATQPINKEAQKQSGVRCKRPPEPPKDKSGRPLPPAKEHHDSQPAKNQPQHDGKYPCPPPLSDKNHKV
ncbi:hypothetical protein V1951_19205 [Yersinia sp. 2544 StPb PI]|uniref:hypothetical protein n=1 Tax=unclassified Yersinia (in: enterobacteria) TaxID=2653513 RepID=UPI0009F49D04|nr:hypothetical protein A6J66_003830 [Yersinia enterocolitica]